MRSISNLDTRYRREHKPLRCSCVAVRHSHYSRTVRAPNSGAGGSRRPKGRPDLLERPLPRDSRSDKKDVWLESLQCGEQLRHRRRSLSKVDESAAELLEGAKLMSECVSLIMVLPMESAEWQP